jgi:5'-deoxynucleotidase YfbR-like HD superfamily hydrolase
MLKVFDFINDLSCTRRWSQAHCLKNESVLEHTAFVAVYSLYLCKKYNIEAEAVLEKALVHDMEEVIIGDIPSVTKYKDEDLLCHIKSAEIDAAIEISDTIFYSQMFTSWSNAKNLSTLSGQIIAVADCAAVVYKIWQEVQFGSKYFLKFTKTVSLTLEKLSHNVCYDLKEEIFTLTKILGKLDEDS